MGLELFTRVHNVIKLKSYYVSVCGKTEKENHDYNVQCFGEEVPNSNRYKYSNEKIDHKKLDDRKIRNTPYEHYNRYMRGICI